MTEPRRQAPTPSPRLTKTRLALTLAASLLGCSGAVAASFGHARILSPQGEPLIIQIPVRDLSAADAQALSAQAAAATDWSRAGLTPPVALDSLRVSVEPGVRPEGRMLRVSSNQPLSGPLADLLLDVRTASGMQRYQVSLVTGARAPAAPPAAPTAGQAGAATAGAAHTSGSRVPQGAIRVRRGDTLFAIARRHAVEGVTVYQMMMALQRANPQAFIQQNVNLVKAGAQLTVPGMDELLAISDREARRQFQIQAAAFAAMRGRLAGAAASVPAQAGNAPSQGRVSEAAAPAEAAPAAGRGDHLQLSDARQSPRDAEADARRSGQLARADTQGRINQLEDNVQHLNEALKSQGEAARNAVVEGAKGISDSIADVAQAIVEAGKAEEADAALRQSSEAGNQAAAAGASRADSSGLAGSAAGAGSSGTTDGGSPNGAGTASTVAPGGASQNTGGASPGTAAGAATGSDAGASSGASSAATANGASPGAAPGGAAPGQGVATAPGQGITSGTDQGTPPASGTPAPGAAADPAANPLASPVPPEAAARAAQAEADAAERSQGVVDWLQEHLLMVMTGLLALIVFIIAWLLRRAGNTRDEAYDAALATEAKVRETLRDIDLELKPRQDDPATKG